MFRILEDLCSTPSIKKKIIMVIIKERFKLTDGQSKINSSTAGRSRPSFSAKISNTYLYAGSIFILLFSRASLNLA